MMDVGSRIPISNQATMARSSARSTSARAPERDFDAASAKARRYNYMGYCNSNILSGIVLWQSSATAPIRTVEEEQKALRIEESRRPGLGHHTRHFSHDFPLPLYTIFLRMLLSPAGQGSRLIRLGVFGPPGWGLTTTISRSWVRTSGAATHLLELYTSPK
jgi:hypothetical protein